MNFGPHFVSANSVAQKRFKEYFIGFNHCIRYNGMGTSEPRTKHPEKRTWGKKRAGLRATAPCTLLLTLPRKSASAPVESE